MRAEPRASGPVTPAVRAQEQHGSPSTQDLADDELLEQACPLVRDLGWRFYFAPATLERGDELGLDGSQFYFLGRGGVLGDVDSRVVASAFGYFNPAHVARSWDAGRAKVAPRDAARAYLACCQDFGRENLGQVPDLEAFCVALEAVNEAADPTGLALYAGISAEPLATDLPARAMQLVTVLRELRGSAHLVALVCSGVAPVVAHFLNRPDAMAMFGWDPADSPTPTDADRERLACAERLTDQIVRPAYAVLDGPGRSALLDGLHAMCEVIAPERHVQA